MQRYVSPTELVADERHYWAIFSKFGWKADHILITENKMNFLTLPDLPSSMAIWSGGGFNIGYL